jgi:hypothetical protein
MARHGRATWRDIEQKLGQVVSCPKLKSGLDVCNGNRINDTERCGNTDCRARLMCDRLALRRADD